MNPERRYEVIRGPVITEKSTRGSEWNQVTFRVALNASKAEIKQAGEELVDVKVTRGNTLRLKGKTKRFRGRPGRRPDIKKAMVTLVEGNTIDITTGV